LAQRHEFRQITSTKSTDEDIQEVWEAIDGSAGGELEMGERGVSTFLCGRVDWDLPICCVFLS
jgi:hypothetical protein